tara:strand:- start:4184 stop:5164 length:981 start_codon:yes stop_codon:yes gene_type:complete
MKKKIYWIHSFNPKIKNAGIFMYNSYNKLLSKGIDIELVYVGRQNPLALLKKIYKLFKLSLVNKNIIIHCQYGSFCSLCAIILPTKNKILSLRGSDINNINLPFGYEKFRNILSRNISLFSIHFYKKIISISDRISNDLKKIYNINSIVLTDSPDSKKIFKINKKKARNYLSLDEDKIYVLFSSINLKNKIKRAELAINSIRKSQLSNKNIELLTLNNVSYDDVNYYINACDFILLTSLSEGWPNIIKEGLVCGKPFISTDVSDLKKIALVEKNCYIVNATVSEISNKILELSKLSYENNIDTKTLSIHVKKFKFIDKLIKLYSEF